MYNANLIVNCGNLRNTQDNSSLISRVSCIIGRVHIYFMISFLCNVQLRSSFTATVDVEWLKTQEHVDSSLSTSVSCLLSALSGPINREMRHLISSLQNHNLQLKGDVQRYKRKLRETQMEINKVDDSIHMLIFVGMFLENQKVWSDTCVFGLSSHSCEHSGTPWWKFFKCGTNIHLHVWWSEDKGQGPCETHLNEFKRIFVSKFRASLQQHP